MHDHNHSHKEKNIKVALLMNISFTVIEIVGGVLTNSLSILSDALHDLGDSIALVTALIGEKISQKKANSRMTFGYQRVSLFSALFSAVVLLLGSLFILYHATQRLFDPQAVKAEGMLLLAIIGIIFNGIAFLRVKTGQSMNERVLSWHLLEDVMGWIVILLGSIVIQITNLTIIDPIMTLCFTIYILFGVLKNIKEIAKILLQGVPSHIDINHLKAGVLKIPGIKDVHDIHVWSLDGETDVFTAHIVVTTEALHAPEKIKEMIKKELRDHHIAHSTIELESEEECEEEKCN